MTGYVAVDHKLLVSRHVDTVDVVLHSRARGEKTRV